MILVVFILVSYLVGALPNATVISYIFCKNDIRMIGSGNPGASNVFRECGTMAGLLTLLLDVSKGAIPVLFTTLELFNDYHFTQLSWLQILFGAASWLGHIFNPFFGFRGGKGVATLMGILLVIFPVGLIFSLLCGFVVMVAYRWFSLGSLVGVSFLPIAWYFFLEDPFNPAHYPLMIFIATALVLTHLRHAENIRSILMGTENTIKIKKKITN